MPSFMILLGEQVLPITSINRTVGVIVWVGAIVFTLAFFILSWTRLGNAKPLVKCLTLSVFAHILLGIFFYGTQMLGLEMDLGGDSPVTISLISEVTEDVALPVADNHKTELPALAEVFPQESLIDTSPQIDSEVESLADLIEGLDDISVDVEPEMIEPSQDVVGTQVAAEDTLVTEHVQQVAAIDEVVEQEKELFPMERVIPLRLDGMKLPESYRGRFKMTVNGQVRGAAFGATPETEAAVKAGVQWLARNQKDDGKWDASEFGAGIDREVDGQIRGATGANADTGISGLALLALMGHGDTHLKGDYRVVVQHGLEYLLEQQASDGNLSGNASLFARMYCHAMATIAVCEAYALTGDNRLREYAEKAVGFTIRSQDPQTGGWRYQPADAGDMSQFGWQVLALHSAQQAGMVVPDRTKERMATFLATCNTGAKGGLAAYRPGFEATRTMTAESLACRMWLDTQRNAAQVKEASNFILMQLPSQNRPDLYYWYYGSLSLRQVGGPAWQTWSDSVKMVVPALQLSDGSWAADTKWGGYGGKVYSTAMAVLCLESFYRYE